MSLQQQKIFTYLEQQIQFQNVLNLSPEITKGEIIEDKYKHSLVQTKTNGVMITYLIDPMDSGMDDAELMRRSDMIATTLSNCFDSHFSVSFDFVRRYKHYQYEDLTASMDDGSAKEIERIRASHFARSAEFFQNKCYMTIYYLPHSDSGIALSKLLNIENILTFITKLQQVEAYFRSAKINLTVLSGDEVAQYLYESVTDDPYGKFRVPSGDWTKTDDGRDEGDNPYSNYTPLSEAIVNHISELSLTSLPIVINGRALQILDLPTMPKYTIPDMVSTLRYIPYPCRLVLKYKALNRNEFSDAVDKVQKKHRSGRITVGGMVSTAFSGQSASGEHVDINESLAAEEAESALEYAHNNSYAGGYFSGCLIISIPKEEQMHLRDIIADIQATLLTAEIPFQACRASNIVAVYLTSLPGSLNYGYHSMLCHAGNVGDFVPISSFVKNRVSKNLKLITGSDVPLLYARHADGSVFNFSPSGPYGEQGMTFITGAPGTGKSILLALMASQWLKYKDSQVVFFDIDLSSLNITQSNHGRVFFPGVDDTSFAPFKDCAEHEDMIVRFIEQICKTNGIQTLTSKMKAAISDTIKHMSPSDESFAAFYALIAGQDNDGLAEILRPYVESYAHIFNSNDDCFLNLPRITTIELGRLLSQTESTEALYIPALTYIFDRLEDYFDGHHPVLLILDEAWRYLQIGYFADFILGWIKRLRKKHVYVVLATQELNDLMGSQNNSASMAIINNCETNIFLPNSRALDVYIGKFYKDIGLREQDIDLIANMPQFTYLVRHNTNTQVAHVDFMVDERQLKYLRTTPDMVEDYKTSMGRD